MGHDKLDNQVKQKLSNRKIQPSTDAWTKLEAMLDSNEEKPKRKITWYYLAAASVVILVLLSVLVFNDNSTTENEWVDTNNDRTIQLEETVSKNQIESVDGVIVQEESVRNEQIVDNTVKAETRVKKTSIPNNLPEKQKFIISPKIEKESNVTESLAVQDNVEENVNNEKSFKLKKEEFDANNALVENSTQKLEDDKLDNEVDALLASALNNLKKEEKIEKEELVKKPATKYSVSPEALLAEAEDEAEESFRAKVFEKIKSGFKKTKTVIATRND